jgi:hypothetical protein
MKAFEISGGFFRYSLYKLVLPPVNPWVSSMNFGRGNFIWWIWGSKGMKIASRNKVRKEVFAMLGKGQSMSEEAEKLPETHRWKGREQR